MTDQRSTSETLKIKQHSLHSFTSIRFVICCCGLIFNCSNINGQTLSIHAHLKKCTKIDRARNSLRLNPSKTILNWNSNTQIRPSDFHLYDCIRSIHTLKWVRKIRKRNKNETYTKTHRNVIEPAKRNFRLHSETVTC